MAKKKRDNTKELIILQTVLVYLTLYLESEDGVIVDGKVQKDIADKFDDVKGAVEIGNQIMFILSRVKVERQQKVLDKAKIIMKKTDETTEFNFFVFSMALLLEYKEHFKGKMYMLATTYDDMNKIYSDYIELGLKDKETMEVIKDSAKIASKFYENVIKYEG